MAGLGPGVMVGAGEELTKFVCEPDGRRILDVGIVGRRAESLIAEGVLAVEVRAVLEDVAPAIAPHPTLSETLYQAAQAGNARRLHLAPSHGATTTGCHLASAW